MNKEKKGFHGIKYTWKHKRAFLKKEKELRGFNTFRGYIHDTDKFFLYIVAWFLNKEPKWVQKIHRQYSSHHVNNSLNKTKEDYIEMVIDWECARETKPDKPLNAYETMKKFYPQLEDEIVPILRELKLLKD